MGQGTTEVTYRSDGASHRTVQLAEEIRELRAQLDDLSDRLVQRVHETFDVKLQARRHPVPALLAGLLAACAVGGGVAFPVLRRRRRARSLETLRRLGQTLSQILEDPDWLTAREPGIGRRLLEAAGTTAMATLAREKQPIARALGAHRTRARR